MIAVRWLFLPVLLLHPALAQNTLKLSSTLTIEKTDDKVKSHENVVRLVAYAKENKLESNVIRFLENTVQQLQKVLDAAKVVEEKKAVEVPADFTPAKYRVKAMPKLQAKKSTVKKMTAKDLRKKLKEGKDLNFDAPLLVTNATALFEDGEWDNIKRHWSAGRIMNDEYLEQNLQVEYWPPDKARARLVGNMLQMEEADMVTFSRYLIICFHGTPAKPKLPGQNTEHCEQTVDATQMIHNSSELEALQIFKEIKNALPLQADFRSRLLAAGDSELDSIIGKGAKKWKRNTARLSFNSFTFGPSGSGDKLHAEQDLPFYDILIHGSRRWLLLTSEEMNRVAAKAREALEFDKTSAYMFFEEKLPELKEEFGLKKYVEANQNAGDMVIVPSGWFRVSLALSDSISYHELILSQKNMLKAINENNVWKPQFRQYQLAYCYEPKDMHTLPGVDKGGQLDEWLKQAIAKVKVEEAITGILATLFQCGSTLALDEKFPELGVRSMSTCTNDVWKQCRKMLETKIKEKGSSATLSWLPKDAPRSPTDVGGNQAAVEKKEEL